MREREKERKRVCVRVFGSFEKRKWKSGSLCSSGSDCLRLPLYERIEKKRTIQNAFSENKPCQPQRISILRNFRSKQTIYKNECAFVYVWRRKYTSIESSGVSIREKLIYIWKLCRRGCRSNSRAVANWQPPSKNDVYVHVRTMATEKLLI